MPVQSDNLIKQICSRLNAGGLTSLQTCQIQNASTIVNNNKVYSVQSCSNLPLASENEGRLIYIRDIGAYRFSNGFTWESCIGSDPSRILCNIIFTWGCNLTGTLADGTTVDRCLPTRESSSAINWCSITTGPFQVSAIKNNGELWSWGCNLNGSLGDGTTINRCSPVREFCSATDWCKVDVGYCFSTALKTSGQIWSWGVNTNGVLGIGNSTTIGRCSPVREFCSATDWCQVSAGSVTVAAIKTSGQLWTWGSNAAGRLGIGDSATIARCSPVREFCSATNWCQVSAGGQNTGAIKTSGELWTWGCNSAGSLGIGSSLVTARCSPVREFCSATDWCQVSTSIFYSMSAVKTSGQIWGWGCGSTFGIGDGVSTNRCSPVREFTSSNDWCNVSRALVTSFGLKTTGQLWAWGSNANGVLGIGNTSTRSFPTLVGCSLNDWVSVCSKRYFAAGILKARQGFCL